MDSNKWRCRCKNPKYYQCDKKEKEEVIKKYKLKRFICGFWKCENCGKYMWSI